MNAALPPPSRLAALEERVEALEYALLAVSGCFAMAGATAFLRRNRVANFGTISASRRILVQRPPLSQWRSPDRILADLDARRGTTDVRIYGGRIRVTDKSRAGGVGISCDCGDLDEGTVPASFSIYDGRGVPRPALVATAAAASAVTPSSAFGASPSVSSSPPPRATKARQSGTGRDVDAELAAVGLKRAPTPTLPPEVSSFIASFQQDVAGAPESQKQDGGKEQK